MQANNLGRLFSFLVEARTFALVVVACTVAAPFCRSLNGGAIISGLSFSLFMAVAGYMAKLPRPKDSNGVPLLQVALFLLYAAGMAWVSVPDFTPNLDVRLGLIAFPATVFFYPLTTAERDKILFWFSVSVSLLAVFMLLVAVKLYMLQGFSYLFAGESLVHPLDLHRVYFALHALAALVFVTMVGSGWAPLFWRRIWQFFLTGIVLLLASRNITLILVLLALLYAGSMVLSRHRKEALLLLIGMAFLVVSAIQLPYVRTIFSTLLQPRADWGQPSAANPTDGLQVRHFIWEAVQNVVPTMPFQGYGTSTARFVLTTEYQKMGFSYGIAEMLNAHNQYLETLLDIGWLGLALLLGLLGYGLVWGWRQNKLLALFMLISILAFATESYLEAQKGIVFFTLFWTILGSAPKKQEAE